MNKLYCSLLASLLLLLPGRSHAQLNGSDSLSLRLASIFAPLDKAQVPTHYLVEAGVRLLPLRLYNCATLSDTNRIKVKLVYSSTQFGDAPRRS